MFSVQTLDIINYESKEGFQRIDLSSDISVKCYPYDRQGREIPSFDLYLYETYNPNIIKETYKHLSKQQILDYILSIMD